MEVDDEAGGTTKSFSDAMLPSLLRGKVDHAPINTWKALSEKDRKGWQTIQVSFFRAAEKNLSANHDIFLKFKTANQRSERRKALTDKEKSSKMHVKKGIDSTIAYGIN
eukprot:5448778-Ditylum_brightwellii.AAC.1